MEGFDNIIILFDYPESFLNEFENMLFSSGCDYVCEQNSLFVNTPSKTEARAIRDFLRTSGAEYFYHVDNCDGNIIYANIRTPNFTSSLEDTFNSDIG